MYTMTRAREGRRMESLTKGTKRLTANTATVTMKKKLEGIFAS